MNRGDIMDIYVVYYIDWYDYHKSKCIMGVFSSWETALEMIESFGDNDEMDYKISRQRINEEFTIELM